MNEVRGLQNEKKDKKIENLENTQKECDSPSPPPPVSTPQTITDDEDEEDIPPPMAPPISTSDSTEDAIEDTPPPLPPTASPPSPADIVEKQQAITKKNKARKPRWGSRDVSVFDILEQVGEGTYGEVFKARCKLTQEVVALKKIRMDKEREGFPITALREIKILKSLDHPNIVNLKEIVTSKGKSGEIDRSSVYLVFEYLDHDMAGLMETPNVVFSKLHIKCYMKQLLEGVAYMHVNKILHRDIKGPNLLLDNEGRLKIADWGLARSWNAANKMGYTNNVITLWYRPPELLLGEVLYGPSVDMWSVGCIFAELLYGKPILPGKDELHQLQLIFQLCGTPTDENWPGYRTLKGAKAFDFKHTQRCSIKETFKSVSPQALELIERLLTLDPKRRISAADALESSYFWSDPMTCQPHELPKFKVSSVHEFEVKRKRMQKEQERREAQKRSKQHHYKPYYHRGRDFDSSRRNR